MERFSIKRPLLFVKLCGFPVIVYELLDKHKAFVLQYPL